MDWSGYVHLAFDEIRLAGAGSPQVARRLISAFVDLLDVVPGDRRAPIEQQLELLRDAIRASDHRQPDRDFADHPDAQGIGVAAGTAPARSAEWLPSHQFADNGR